MRVRSQSGCYFITIYVQHKKYLFGNVSNDEMKLNAAGTMVQHAWVDLKNKFNNIEIDAYIVMPNHLHGIIIIPNNDPVGATLVVAHIDDTHKPSQTIGNIIGAFKSITTNKYIREVRNNNFAPFDKILWQRNYYEHIIRNDEAFYKIREYIFNNPSNWGKDVMSQEKILKINKHREKME
ncbi:MAG: hypothetical protein A3G71_03180 [Gammaproteobacteria bacterium RIFCSPLOWO2_12_FULL_38_14]|nr:MAG: hypothetical protein A3G71_03180 [Gammaproteobacteria bacterium RIFCSPLOWO2_12_FULL_38_14]